MKSFIRALLVIVLLVAIGAVAGYMSLQAFLKTPASSSAEVVVFEVSPGQSFKAVVRGLESQGLIKNARVLELYTRFTTGGPIVKVGEYAIPRNANPIEIMGIIRSGKSIEYPVTVAEGYNIFEVADVVERAKIASKEEFLALVRDRKLVKELTGEERASLEGYLFPETYNVTKFTGPVGLIRMMVARFNENYAKATEGVTTTLSKHELVTLASIIEKETGAPEERPLISSVFHNRLKLNMKLQTDPTVIYGVWEKTGVWNKNISRADLLTPNRYNTYTFSGLPYGPISNPGYEALRAAFVPAESDFLFFVSKNEGTHVFSKDFGAHQKAVNDFQVNKSAREGKSWRDLKKRPKAAAQQK
ncbi:MAG: endolytic transglycosylase MltG [Bdellovibrionota bacterium]